MNGRKTGHQLFPWDFIYGIPTVKYYGNPHIVNIASAAPRTNFYPVVIQTATQQAKNVERKKQEHKQRKEEQDNARKERAAQ